MISIKNKEIDVSVVDVLTTFRDYYYKTTGRIIFKDIKDNGDDNLQITCPRHKNGIESRPSCGVLKKEKDGKPEGTFHCFTCGYTGTIQQVISDLLGANDSGLAGERWLIDNFIDNVYEGRERLTFDMSRTKPQKYKMFISEDELKKYRYYHNYMWQRKLTREVVNLFDVGYDTETRTITFPVNDINGNCVFIARRSVDTKKFLLPKDIDKPVYGLDKVLKNGQTEIIVCESVFNALTCYVYGNIPGVALFGTGSSKQYDILRKTPIRHYILAFDGDDAGDRGRNKFIEALKDYAFISYLKLPRGKDLNDLTKDEFDNLEKISINF